MLFRALYGRVNIPSSSLKRAVDDISLEDLLSTVPSLEVERDN